MGHITRNELGDSLNTELGLGSNLQTTAKTYAEAINENHNQIGNLSLLSESIKGTTQNTTINGDGTIQQIQHVDSNNNVIRTDAFTYASNLITEVRTLNTGGTVTFKYHLDTLQTEVI